MALLRIAAALAVALGIVIWLAPEPDRLLEPAAAAPAPPPLERIEIASVELPAPEPAPLPEAEPEPAPEAEPVSTPQPPAPEATTAKPPPPEPPGVPAVREAVRPGADALARGHTRLREGVFPRLRASYARIGFARYRDAVLGLGGVFYLFDPASRKVLAQVDPRTHESFAVEQRSDLSQWPRDVTRHLAPALERGRERYGERAGRVILLPPARIDAALLGALDQELRALSLAPERLVRVDVAYEMRDGRLHCEVLAVALREAGERPLDLLIDLSGGIRT